MIPPVLLYFVTVAFVTFASIWCYFHYAFLHWKKHGIIHIPPVFPYGNFKNFILQKKNFGDNLIELYQQLKAAGGKLAGVYIFSMPVVFPVDIDLVKSILIQDFTHFTDHGIYEDEERDPLSGHLFSLRGQRWKKLRAKITPTFSSGKIKMMFSIVSSVNDKLLAIIEKRGNASEPLDMKDIMSKFTNDITATCGFGIECNSLENPDEEFRRMLLRFFQIKNLTDVIRRMCLMSFPKLMSVLKLTIVPAETNQFFLTTPRKIIEYREKNNIERQDFMQLMIQLKNDGRLKKSEDEHFPNSTDSSKLTFNEIAAQCFVFLIGGYDTTSTALTFLLYELCVNPKIQQKVREEAIKVLKANNGQLNYETIGDLTYLEKAIFESLRKYPPLPYLNRECTKDYKVAGTSYTIKKGDKLFIPAQAFHMDPDLFPEPEKFDPERFNEENRSNLFLMTFGEGPRICIGKRFALVVIKLVVSSILLKYKLTLNPKTKVPVTLDPRALFTISPLGKVLIDVERL